MGARTLISLRPDERSKLAAELRVGAHKPLGRCITVVDSDTTLGQQLANIALAAAYSSGYSYLQFQRFFFSLAYGIKFSSVSSMR